MSRNTRDQRYALLTRRIPEHLILNHGAIYNCLSNENRRPRILWLTSPTGRPHIGYMIPLLKFIEFIRANCDIVVVLLDSYSYLDNVKAPWDQVIERLKVYRYTIEAAATALGIDPRRLIFVQESHHETNERWLRDCWKMCTLVQQQDVKNAWDRSYNPDMLSPMFCPVHQALCEEYLDCDIQFGGEDQHRLFQFGDRFLPKLGYRVRGHLMNPMLSNLTGGKMSSSHPAETKLMFIEEPSKLAAKLAKSYNHHHLHQQTTTIDSNAKFTSGPMMILAHILIPYSTLLSERHHPDPNTATTIDALPLLTNPDRHPNTPFWTPSAPPGTVFTLTHPLSQTIHFTSFDDIASALNQGTITWDAVHQAITNAVTQLCAPIRDIWLRSPEWQAADRLAYPDDYE